MGARRASSLTAILHNRYRPATVQMHGDTNVLRAFSLLAVTILIAPLLPTGSAADTEPQIIELKGVAPDWFTPALEEAAVAAAREGKAIDPLTGQVFEPREAAVPGGIPYGSPDYLFVRPGALAVGSSGSLCTYNFVYSSSAQIGTAGHCVSTPGERFYILAFPRPLSPVTLFVYLGTVAGYSNGGIGNDWALINIDPVWAPYVDPNMAWIGGPSCASWSGNGGPMKHTGHGIQTGLVASVPRASYAFVSNGQSFNGLGEVSGGDSGSAIIQASFSPGCTGGNAAGVITHCASVTRVECLPIFYATDIRVVPATVTTGFDPL